MFCSTQKLYTQLKHTWSRLLVNLSLTGFKTTFYTTL